MTGKILLTWREERALDDELLARFVSVNAPATLGYVFADITPHWARAAFDRLLARGLIEEFESLFVVTPTGLDQHDRAKANFHGRGLVPMELCRGHNHYGIDPPQPLARAG
jgi:hypothetical protein